MKKLFSLLLAFVAVFTLAGCNNDGEDPVGTTQEDVDALIAQVFLAGDASNIMGNIELPTTVGEGVTITWTSSNEAVISTTGEVTRDGKDGENQVVTLTASVTVDDLTATKEFRLRVLKFEVDPSTTIAAIKATAKDEQVYAVGFKVLAIYQAGYYITDGTDIMNVYTGGTPALTVGNEVTVSGNMGSYRDAQQIVDSVFEITNATSTIADPTMPTESALISSIDAVYADHSAYNTIVYLKGIIVVEEGEFTDYYLQDKDDPSQRYEIYYKSPAGTLDALKALNGKYVEGIFYLYNSGYIMTFETADTFNEIVLTADEQIKAELAADTSGFAQVVETFSLPNTVAGKTIVWTTDATSIVATVNGENTDFTVTRPEGDGAVDEVTTIVGTYDTDQTVVFDVTVKAKVSIETVAEVVALADGEAVLTSPFLVTAVIQNGVYVTDGTDYIFVYTGGAPEGVVVGNYVTVQGIRGTYSGTIQIKNPTMTVVDATDPVIEEPDLSDDVYTVDQVVAGMADGSLIGKVVQVYGTLSIQGTYNNVFFNNPTDGDVEFEVYYKSPADSVTALEAQDGNTVIATLYVYSDSGVVFVGAAEDITVVGATVGIADVVAVANDTEVVLGNVKVADVIKNGFYVTDGTSYMFVYTGGYPSDMVVKGSEVLVLGIRGEYSGTQQIKNPTVVVLSETSTIADVAAPTTVTTMADLVAGMADGSLIGTVVKVSATVSLQGDYNNAYLNDAADADVEVEVYYKSPSDSVAAVKAQDGNTITLNVYVYSDSSVVFVGEASDIVTE